MDTRQSGLNQFSQLEMLVTEAVRTAPPAEKPALQSLRPFLDNLRKAVEDLGALKQKLGEVEQMLALLSEPPLQYGVFLGLTPDHARDSSGEDQAVLWLRLDSLLAERMRNEANPDQQAQLAEIQQMLQELRGSVSSSRDLLIGLGGQRFEVSLAASGLNPHELQQGQEVVVNKAHNVVGVRANNTRGDTVEVANVISPRESARVMAVPDQGNKVQVQWASGDRSDRFEVDCVPELRQELRRGDIVALDESKQKIMGRVKPRLHVRSGGSEGIVVEISEELFHDGVDIGDIVRADTRLQFAYEKLPSYQTGGLALEEVPDVTFSDIGGLDAEIEHIRDAIELPYLYRRLFEEYSLGRTKGILLFGPPGCGKTMIAKAIANSLTQSIRDHLTYLENEVSAYLMLQKDPGRANALTREHLAWHGNLTDTDEAAPTAESRLALLAANLRANDVDPDAAEEALRRIQSVLRREGGVRSFFLNVKGPELLSKWVGDTEHRIRKIFEEAKRAASYYTPVVIFFDEMEAMFRARGSGRSSDVETTIVPQFLSEMDGVESSENVIIIGASNRADIIDPAIMRPGRLDVKIKIERPSQEASWKIMALNLTPDLPLRAEGLKRPADEIERAVTFKPHVVRRTLLASAAPESLGQVDEVLAAVVALGDARQALASSPFRDHWYRHQPVRDMLTQAARREQIAEALIREAVDLLFSIGSRLEATTSDGERHAFHLRQFTSGALLGGIVSRAKIAAVKRRANNKDLSDGITIHDLQDALREEFVESGDQLAARALEYHLASGKTVQRVQIVLESIEEDPWDMEKVRLY